MNKAIMKLMSFLTIYLGVALPEVFAESTILFSKDSSLLAQAESVVLTNLTGRGEIRYTVNGDLPRADSSLYQGALPIDQSTVIRAQIFEGGTPISGVVTKSYLFVPVSPLTIPVVSLTSDRSHWGLTPKPSEMKKVRLEDFRGDGILVHASERGRQWERPVNLEYFAPDGDLKFNIKAGIRIQGNFTRLFSPKKSLRLYFRKSYGGPGKLKYPLFEGSPVQSFDKLVLRANFQDTMIISNQPGSDNKHRTNAKYIADQVTRNLQLAMGDLAPRGRWVFVYINGYAWGLYNLTERLDKEFFESHMASEGDQFDLITPEGGFDKNLVWHSPYEDAKEGTYAAWGENQDWVGRVDFSRAERIEELKSRVDTDNWFNYLTLHAYVQNRDWPGANWFVYKDNNPGAPDPRFKLITWDAEYALGSGGGGYRWDESGMRRATSPHDSITRILEKPFISNCGFKLSFVQRAGEILGIDHYVAASQRPADEINHLTPAKVWAEIEKQANIIKPYIATELAIWAPDKTYQDWEKNVWDLARHFVDHRHEILERDLRNLRKQCD